MSINDIKKVCKGFLINFLKKTKELFFTLVQKEFSQEYEKKIPPKPNNPRLVSPRIKKNRNSNPYDNQILNIR